MNAILDPWVAGGLLVAFSAVWVFLGWYWGRANESAEDFMLAGRRVGLALGTATAMATWVTSNTTMTAPQLAYELGVWGMLGYSLGSVGLLLFAPMARRIRALMPGGFTSGDFVRLRYGPVAWRIFLVISIVYSAGWLVSLGTAGGVLIEALSGLPFEIGMTVILTVCVAYTVLGGLRAVIGTDYIQTIVIVAGVVLLGYLVIRHVGLEDVHRALEAERPELLNLLMPASLMFLFNNLLFGVGEIFHSNVWWSRAFAFGKDVGFKAYLLAGLFWTPIPIAAGFLALAAPAIGLNVPAADMVGPMVAAHLLGTAGAVMVFVIVLSALASSLDSLLAATSDLVVEDVYRRHLRPNATPAQMRRAAFVTIISLGVVTWLVCLPRIATLAEILNFSGALVASAIWPIAMGLFCARTNRVGAGVAMVAGSVVGLYSYFAVAWYVSALASAAVSMLCVVVSTWARPEEFDWDTLSEADPA